jgi:transcriptional regulator with XRE-family HTH domain
MAKAPKVFGYKTYNFRDKDPIIDQLRTIILDEKLDYKKIAEDSGVRETTIMAWFYGLTRRPQYATVKAICVACGYDISFSKREVLVPMRRRI